MKPIIQLITCVILALPLLVFAGDERPGIYKQLRQSPSIENRKTLASHLLLHWERIDKAIPRLSPDEKKWLEDEINAGRINFNRKEFGQKFAQKELVHQVNALRGALKGIGNSNNVKEEIGLWVMVYRELSNRDMYLYLSGLVNNGVISPPPHTNISEEIPMIYLSVSNYIINDIIIGYFFGHDK